MASCLRRNLTLIWCQGSCSLHPRYPHSQMPENVQKGLNYSNLLTVQMWICVYCGVCVCVCGGGCCYVWQQVRRERWRRGATCRSALRTSLPSEHLLSESWRQHCGALSAPSPTEAPVHAKQAPAALSPWPRFIHLPATFPLGNKQTSLYSAPPPTEPESAFDPATSRQTGSVMVTTRTSTATSDGDNFRERSTSRAGCDY